MSTTTSDKAEIVPNIVTEESNGEGSSAENKARNRMVAEGYKYHAVNNNGQSDILDPIEDEVTRTRRQRWRKVLFILVIALVMITCLVVVIVVQHVHSVQQEEKKACTTPSCVMGAANILSKMDTNVNPCDNFYQFSCGNWVKNTPIPPSKSKYGSFQKIAAEIETIMKEIMESETSTYKGVESSAIHKTTAYYKMCVNETKVDSDGVGPVLKLIKDLGSWPLTNDEQSGTFDPQTWNIQDSVLLTHQHGLSPLFHMTVGVDSKNNTAYVLQMDQSGLTLSDAREYFTNHTDFATLKEAYMGFGKKFLALLGATDNVEQQLNDIYDFEQKLAMIQVPRADINDPVKSYNKMKLKEFQDNYMGQWFDIQPYVNGLYREIRIITEDEIVIVSTPSYFTKLGSLIAETDKRTLANYMIWHSVQGLSGYLPSSFLEATIILDKAESGVKAYDVRWKRCLSKTSIILGNAFGALYVEKNFAEENKKEVETMFEEIKDAFIKNLYNVDWMDDQTRDYAVDKAKAVTKMIGYPDFIADPAKLDKYYENVKQKNLDDQTRDYAVDKPQAVTKMIGYPDFIADPAKLDKYYENLTLVEGSFFDSKLATMRYYKEKNLKRLGTLPDRTEWDMIPTEVNAYYSIDFNQIAFPAGILRPPLYNPDKPKSFNFGSFGMICGHELTHGFDNKGRNFDKMGNMNNWWTNKSTEKFDEKTQCFVDFYGNYSEAGTQLDGALTLSENIADNGGMKMAYLAFQHWRASNRGDDSFKLPGLEYTPDQLFFIGMAQLWCSHYTPEYTQKAILTDVHSIAKYRVLASMANSQNFAQAYSCPANSPMNPDKKCAVW